MEIKTKQLNRVDLITISGRVDSNAAARLEDALKACTEAERYCIVIDMHGLEYISSRGLRALVTALKETQEWNRGDLRLCNVPPRIQSVLDLTGFTPLFKIYDNTVDAVGSF
ncbi:MAG TPA: STAS domain-containing protein [Anaerolineae bacterium]|nr:STAS domain-containing protein [Anaerolineae bacterium]